MADRGFAFNDSMSEWMDAGERAAEVSAEHRQVGIADGVVVRPVLPVTRTVHSFLAHLREQGLDCVPEPRGILGDREQLAFLDGDSGGDGWRHQHTDEGLASAARLLRRIHDAGTTWSPPDEAVWGMRPVAGDDVVFCHGDPGPWNFVWRDQQALGLIDWDYLHPAPRPDDIAYALHWFVPLRSDELALEWHHFPEVPDRRHRIQVFLEAYGDLPAVDVVATVLARMQATMDLCRELAEQGQEPQRTWVEEGWLEHDAAEIAWVREHAPDFT